MNKLEEIDSFCVSHNRYFGNDRIIKFRVINKINGEIVGYEQLEGGLWVKRESGSKVWEHGTFVGDGKTTYLVRDQFTGKKDMRGNEIYLNDIIKYDHEDGLCIARVVYEDQHDDENPNICVFKYWVIRIDDHRDIDDDPYFDVIGNIHSSIVIK